MGCFYTLDTVESKEFKSFIVVLLEGMAGSQGMEVADGKRVEKVMVLDLSCRAGAVLL